MIVSELWQGLGQVVGRVLIGGLFITAGVFEVHGQSFYFPYFSTVGTAQPESFRWAT